MITQLISLLYSVGSKTAEKRNGKSMFTTLYRGQLTACTIFLTFQRLRESYSLAKTRHAVILSAVRVCSLVRRRLLRRHCERKLHSRKLRVQAVQRRVRVKNCDQNRAALCFLTRPQINCSARDTSARS